LTEDAWIEALASFVVNKPPSRWSRADNETWRSEIEALGSLFLRTEAAAYSMGPEPSKSAVRLGMTRADGVEIARVIEVPSDDSLSPLIDRLEKALPPSKDTRLAALYFMLWRELGTPRDGARPPAVEVDDKSSAG
jgi:hypothetical protein